MQQWLNERASISHYTYTACLVHHEQGVLGVSVIHYRLFDNSPLQRTATWPKQSKQKPTQWIKAQRVMNSTARHISVRAVNLQIFTSVFIQLHLSLY
jgi:hypothetical protein